MNDRERMLRACRGEWADRLPWAPRIDLWYNANSLRGTLPARYRPGITLDEIADDIGGGYHKIVADYHQARSPEDHVDRGIGVQNRWGLAYRCELRGVEREVERNGMATRVTYHTPVGSISTLLVFTEEMRRAGVSIPWRAEHAIRKPEDYRTAGYIFKNIRVHPDYGNYLDFFRQVGDRGIAVAYANDSAGPMHFILKNLLDITTFYLEMYDHPQEMRQLCEDLEPFFDQILRVMENSPAEVIFFGANFDEMITYPPFFREHILPCMQKFADRLHARGKLILSHCDGESRSLLELFRESGMDVAEAICPQPMTRVRIGEVKEAFQGKVTIFGGVPSVALLEESMSDEGFEKFMEDLFREISPGERFILGISDTTPPNAKFERLLRITERVRQWGELPMRL